MKLAFLTLAYPISESDSNLYSDLFDEIASRGNEVIVFKPDETKNIGKLSISYRHSVKVISVPVGKVTQASLLSKLVNTMLLGIRYAHAFYVSGVGDIDVIVYSTPPISLADAVQRIKKTARCQTYLLLKDIFPQNAVDLKLLRYRSIIWNYFRGVEVRLYRISDHIGCMSPANIAYMQRHNSYIESGRIHLLPNCIKPRKVVKTNKYDNNIIAKYNIPRDSLKLIYGGNIGVPQDTDVILKSVEAVSKIDHIFTVIVGNGTEYGKIKKGIMSMNSKNVLLLDYLPKEDYTMLLSLMDVGLVFLNSSFTVPNFPSRILDYMDMALPILAATDEASDVKQEICDVGAGKWCKSGDVSTFLEYAIFFRDNPDQCVSMGLAARELLEKKYNAEYSATIMLNRINSIR